MNALPHLVGLTERYSTSDDGRTLVVEYTLEDPGYLTESYTGSVKLVRAADDTAMYPFDCDTDSASRFTCGR